MTYGPKYTVVAVAPSGNEKVVATGVGGMRATKVAKEVERRGFSARVEKEGSK